MIARIDARVAEGKAVIFLTYHGTNACIAQDVARKSARAIAGRTGLSMSRKAPAPRTSRSRLAAESYGCDYRRNGRAAQTCKGKTAYAAIKTSDFMVELD